MTPTVRVKDGGSTSPWNAVLRRILRLWLICDVCGESQRFLINVLLLLYHPDEEQQTGVVCEGSSSSQILPVYDFEVKISRHWLEAPEVRGGSDRGGGQHHWNMLSLSGTNGIRRVRSWWCLKTRTDSVGSRRTRCSGTIIPGASPTPPGQRRFSEVQKEGRDSCIPGRKTCWRRWTTRRLPARDAPHER